MSSIYLKSELTIMCCTVRQTCSFCGEKQADVFAHIRLPGAACDRFYCLDCLTLEWWAKVFQFEYGESALTLLAVRSLELRAKYGVGNGGEK